MSVTDSTRQKYPLSHLKVWKKVVASLFGWFVFFILIDAVGLPVTSWITSANHIAVPGYIFPWMILGPIIFLAILFTVNLIYQQLYYSDYYYDLTDSFIIIRKGVVTPKEISIPYERVQDVYVDRDVFDRIFGLYDVHLSTATYTSGMEAHIDGVEKQAADGLREILLTTISQKIHHSAAPSNNNNGPQQ